MRLRRIEFPAGLQDALSNIGRSCNSMVKSVRMRARRTKDLPFRVKDAREDPVDVLWFVGDHASYDPRALEVSRRLATLLHTAGVDFGILYDAEQNSGNDVRRCGEEGLFGSACPVEHRSAQRLLFPAGADHRPLTPGTRSGTSIRVSACRSTSFITRHC